MAGRGTQNADGGATVKKLKTFSFLYLRDRCDYADDKLRVRHYLAPSLSVACDKMEKFLRGIEERSENTPWVDEDAVEFSGKLRKEHFIGDHSLREFC